MRIRATFSEHGRVAGQDYSVPFYIGCRLINVFHAKWIAREPGEPDWKPSPGRCVDPNGVQVQAAINQQRGLDGPPADKMIRRRVVRRKGAADRG